MKPLSRGWLLGSLPCACLCEPAAGQRSASTRLGETGLRQVFWPRNLKATLPARTGWCPPHMHSDPLCGPASQPSFCWARVRLPGRTTPCCLRDTMADERSHCRFPNRTNDSRTTEKRSDSLKSHSRSELAQRQWLSGLGDARLEWITIETVSPKVTLLHFIFWLFPLLFPPPSAAWLSSQHLGSWSPSLVRPEPLPAEAAPWRGPCSLTGAFSGGELDAGR